MSFFGQILAVTRKDLLVELRSPVRIIGVFFFALALLLIVALASTGGVEELRHWAAGAMWVGLLLGSTRALDQSLTAEKENGSLEGMVLWPVDPIAMYYGKALANTLVLAVVAVALCPLVIAIFDAPIRGSLPTYFALLLLGCAALAASGTVYASITTQVRGSSALLPVLLFPVVAPAFLAAARGTAFVLEGDPMGQSRVALGLLLAFNLLHWSLSGVLFTWLVEDG